MSTARPFAYNLGQPITGTTQLGDLAIGIDNLDYSEQPGGVQWWNGPDEELGYIITHTTPSGTQPNPVGIPAYLGFWRSKVKTEGSFIAIAQWVAAKYNDPQTFATGIDASTWLNDNGFWTSYNQVILTPTPTPTETQPEPTPTPTPTETPIPVTGYGFNLVALPYDFPLSGNSIMNNDPSTGNTGSTEINVLGTSGRGFYFNTLDENGVDRTSYFSTFTGQNITITFNQDGNVAIYSGDTDSLKYYNQTGDTGFVFGTGIGVPPSPSPSGVATLIQSSPVNYTIGLPVYVSVELNVPLTPTPTPTETQPIPTPTPTETQPIPTPTPTETEPIPTPTPTETQPIPTPTPTETQPIPTPTPTATPSGFTITIIQSGPNVLMSASGTLNIDDLTYVTTDTLAGAGLGINTATFIMGSLGNFDTYSGFTTTPTNFGTGSGLASTSSSGDIMGVIFQGTPPYQLVVPEGYISGDNIFSTQVFNGETLSSLGLVEGTYTYTWGSGANADAINVIVGGGASPTPTPTATLSTPTPTPTSGASGNGWSFYTPEGTLQGPPSSSGQTVFVIPSGVGPNVSTFNPNYTGSNISLYFNEYTTDGVSYNTEFQNLDTNGGTITITQNGDSVTYSGTALNFLYGTSPNNFLGVQVTNSSQLISPSVAPFVSGSPITILVI